MVNSLYYVLALLLLLSPSGCTTRAPFQGHAIGDLATVSPMQLAAVRDRELIAINVDSGQVVKYGKADFVAASRSHGLVAAVLRADRASRVRIFRVSAEGTWEERGCWEFPLCPTDLVATNSQLFGFCLLGVVPGSPDSAGPFVATLLHEEEHLLGTAPLPVVSVLASFAYPDGTRFANGSEWTFGALVQLSLLAKDVLIPTNAIEDGPFELDLPDPYLLLVSSGRLVKALRVPARVGGTDMGRPIGFSGDGQQMLTQLPLREEWSYVRVDVRSGRTEPCEFIPTSAQVLATSGGLDRVIAREYVNGDDGHFHLTYIDDKLNRTVLATLPRGRNVLAAFSDSRFVATDGETL